MHLPSHVISALQGESVQRDVITTHGAGVIPMPMPPGPLPIISPLRGLWKSIRTSESITCRRVVGFCLLRPFLCRAGRCTRHNFDNMGVRTLSNLSVHFLSIQLEAPPTVHDRKQEHDKRVTHPLWYATRRNVRSRRRTYSAETSRRSHASMLQCSRPPITGAYQICSFVFSDT